MILFLLGSSSGEAIWMIILFVVIIGTLTVCGLFIPALKKSRFNEVKSDLEIGMTEDEVIERFGEPKKVVFVDDTTKVILYTYGHEHFVRGNIVTQEVLAVIKDGEVISITK